MSQPDRSLFQALEFGNEKVEVEVDEDGNIKNVTVQTAGLHPTIWVKTTWRDTDLQISVNHVWLEGAYKAGQWEHSPIGQGKESLKKGEDRPND